MPIYHVGSSDRNPVTWAKVRDSICEFWNSNPSISRISKAGIVYSENQHLIRFNELRRRIPVVMYSNVAPLMGKQHAKNAEKMKKTYERGE